MNPDEKLSKAVFERHSVRSFLDKPLGERVLKSVRAEISYATSLDATIHFQLKLADDKPFAGFSASYGMFRNAKNYLACVVDTSYDDCMIRAGFWAEMVALRAVDAGLGTCFVSGTYKSGAIDAQLRVTWRIPFIVLLGYADDRKPTLMARITKSLAGSKHRPDTASMLAPGSLSFTEVSQRWPELVKALEGVACAPSSMNRRPARIKITATADDSDLPLVTATNVKDYKGADIDLGIAMANWQACAGGEWDFEAENGPVWLS